MNELLSMFVVSDLHCIGPRALKDQSRDSLLHLPAPADLLRSPLNGLHRLIETRGIEADVLVCCGDLTNRAEAEGFELGWAELERLAERLGSSSILFTPGNHDMDVYDVNGTGDHLSSLAAATRDPSLVLPRVTDHELLTHGFELHDRGSYRVINIDTNGRNPVPRRGKVGHVDLATIDTLEAVLEGLDPVDCYLLLCHHHPLRHGDIDADDYSAFTNAPELLAMTERLPDAAWYMIHGHKHFPRIGSVSSTTTVFSAGSVAGAFYGPQQCVARNQAYLLRLGSDPALGPAHPPVVEFNAWDWAAVKWIPAKDGFNIPRNGGFGARVVTPNFTRQIAEFVLSSEGERCSAEAVATRFPELKYLPPQDIERCVESLFARHDIDILTSRSTGEWRELGVRAS